MKKTLCKVLVLALVLCLVLPQTAMAATYNYLEVSIEETADGDPKVTAESARYLQDNEPLAALIYTAINTKYADNSLKVFASDAMEQIMVAGIAAYEAEVGGTTGAWAAWVAGYDAGVAGDLKALAADLTSVIGDLTVGQAYTMSYDIYTVTATRKTHSTGGGGGGYIAPVTPAEPAHTCYVKHLTDVDVNAWYHTAVCYCVQHGIMIGVDADTFAVNGTLTRGMLMTMLAREAGVDTAGGEPWYTKGMEWAVANGVSDGTNPEADITREQLVTMLYRYAKLTGKDVSAAAELTAYTDAADVSDWALDAAKWAVASGVMQGDAGKLNPQGSATRAEAAQFFYNFVK